MRRVAFSALLAGLVLFAAGSALAETPDYEGEFFTDLTHTVPARTSVEISRTLRVAAEASRVHPMLVVIDRMSNYPSLPQNERDFATTLANEWKIGDVTTKEGILALFAVGDHKFYVAKTPNVSQSVTDGITESFHRGTLDALKSGNVGQAMSRAAQAIASALPAHGQSSGPVGATGTHTVTRTTHEHVVQDSPPSYRYHHSFDGGVCLCPIIGFGLIIWVVFSLIGSLFGRARSWGYGSNYGGYYGGGGGGFFSGMATGGLLGYLFGNSGSSYGSYGSYGSSGQSYTDTTTTTTDTSWSSGGSSDSSSSGGGFDSFGGGNFDGGGSGGSW